MKNNIAFIKLEPGAADAIKKLILSSDLRRELANKGYEHVKKFNWINSSNETFCFIEEILMNYKKN